MAVRELTLEEKLQRFVERWRNYSGTEIADTQGFIRHLAECYEKWDYEPGTVFEQHPVEAEDTQQAFFEDLPQRKTNTRSSQQRMDFYLRGVVIWEQKGPKEELGRHVDQLWLYWVKRQSRYLVLCNFREFWIWDTDEENWQGRPPFKLLLEELPQQPGALEFLRGGESYFARAGERVTRDAARYVGDFLRKLVQQSGNPQVDRPRFTKFTLECVFAMFAEDSKPPIFKSEVFTRAMEKAVAGGDLSPVYNLFDDLGRSDESDRTNLVPYVNGPLYDRNPKIGAGIDPNVLRDLLSTLLIASRDFDWQYVRPEVFGSIFERSLLADERHAAGAHFTSEADIMKVVGPTIVRPWRERIEAVKSHKDVEALIERMKRFHVLDPACGSGNFLYVAYREMKGLEADLRARWTDQYRKLPNVKSRAQIPPPPPGPYFGISQLHGIDKLDEAVQLTRVVLWIGEYLVNQELSLGETTLPLTSLESNIVQADALFTDWFPSDNADPRELAIIGNPPFMGRHKMRRAMGDEYVDELHKAFPHNRNADLVTYWYPKAIETLREGERAGFVSSNSIAQNESREASLDRIIEAGGTLHDCWKSYPWPGEAAVHVSIVNWIMEPEYSGICHLDGGPTDQISVSLTDKTETSSARRLAANLNLCFEGIKPGNNEFVIDKETRDNLVRDNPNSKDVIHPLLIGRDIAQRPDQSPSRYVIDFLDMGLEEAKRRSAAFRYVQEHVYPARSSEFERKTEREKRRWWIHERPRPEMRQAIARLDHFLVVPRVSPHMIFSRVAHGVVPDSRLKVIALGSWFHFGVLQSAVHDYWAWARGATFKADLSYTNTTIFETFPFPSQREAPYDPRTIPHSKAARLLEVLAERIYSKRQEACIALGIGITKLYNYIKEKTPLDGLNTEHRQLVLDLAALHAEMSGYVCACYGWPDDIWRDENEVLTRLMELNRLLNS